MAVVVGGLVSAAAGFFAARWEARRQFAMWQTEEQIRSTEEEFTAISAYVGAAAAWQTRLGSYRDAVRDKATTVGMLDETAAEFHRLRFCAAVLVCDETLRGALDMMQDALQKLFELALVPADGLLWDPQWGEVERCLLGAADAARAERERRMEHYRNPV